MSDATRKKLSASNKGKNNPNSKLNEEIVKEIKIIFNDPERKCTRKEIAKIFKVSRHAIDLILNGKTWVHVHTD